MHEGTVAGWVTDSTRSATFVAFLQDLVNQTPAGLELHCIIDNLSAHGTPLVEEFLDRPENSHVFPHNRSVCSVPASPRCTPPIATPCDRMPAGLFRTGDSAMRHRRVEATFTTCDEGLTVRP